MTNKTERPRCRYEDCVNGHPLAAEDEQVTCPQCRLDLCLPPIPNRPTSAPKPPPPRCDQHPDREATRSLGAHAPIGDGSSGFVASRHLCAECYAEWKRRNVAFEYVR